MSDAKVFLGDGVLDHAKKEKVLPRANQFHPAQEERRSCDRDQRRRILRHGGVEVNARKVKIRRGPTMRCGVIGLMARLSVGPIELVVAFEWATIDSASTVFAGRGERAGGPSAGAKVV